MEKSDAPTFAHLGRKTALGEEILNGFMNCHPIDSCLDLLQSQRLAGFHCIPKFALGVACAPAQNRPGHVAKVAALGVPRENVENDEGVGIKRTESALVRITGLIAAGNNCACRNAA